MVEMRWYTDYTRSEHNSDVCYEDRRLQYRVMEDRTAYGRISGSSFLPDIPVSNKQKNMQWSKWMDVPEVVKGG